MDDRTDSRTDNLYERDFYSWTQEQAALLKEGRISSADIANIVEELETLGRSELGALVSAYKLVAHHLFKLTYAADEMRRTRPGSHRAFACEAALHPGGGGNRRVFPGVVAG